MSWYSQYSYGLMRNDHCAINATAHSHQMLSRSTVDYLVLWTHHSSLSVNEVCNVEDEDDRDLFLVMETLIIRGTLTRPYI